MKRGHEFVEIGDRSYRITDTGYPFERGEYLTGGIIISTLIKTDRISEYVYLTNCEDWEAVKATLDLFRRNYENRSKKN